MNVNYNKIVPIVIGVAVAVFAISMVLRFALFSGYGIGIPTSYLLLGLPGAGIGLLLPRLGVFTGGQRSSGFVGPWQHNLGGQPQFPGAQSPTAAQHLQELDHMYHAGAISPADYAARRQQIIATI